MPKYYTQPLNLSLLMKGKEHPSCTLQQSIAQRIHLLLITNFNECRYDREFGSVIWEHDFENLPNINQWKDQMAKSVKEELEKYEKRLINIKTTLELTEQEFIDNDKNRYKKLKRRIDINVNASLKSTNEPFYFQEVLYVSPIWTD